MAPATPAWEVTSQREDWQVWPETGQATQGMTVAFRTAGGSTGTIFLPADRYTVENVRAAIAAKAAAIESIAGLKG